MCEQALQHNTYRGLLQQPELAELYCRVHVAEDRQHLATHALGPVCGRHAVDVCGVWVCVVGEQVAGELGPLQVDGPVQRRPAVVVRDRERRVYEEMIREVSA
jgi:hypothetical protein